MADRTKVISRCLFGLTLLNQLQFTHGRVVGSCSGTYLSNNSLKECMLCPAGTFMRNHCTTNGGRSDCQTCPTGQYQPFCNEAISCAPCYPCSRHGAIEQSTCTATQDTICVCPPGRFYQRHSSVEGLCVTHKTCQAGFGVIKNGSAVEDTICDMCASGTFSDTDSHDPCQPCSLCYAYISQCTRTTDAKCENVTSPPPETGIGKSGLSKGEIIAIGMGCSAAVVAAAIVVGVVAAVRRKILRRKNVEREPMGLMRSQSRVNGCSNGDIETTRTLNAALDETDAFEGALNTETNTPARVLGSEPVNSSNHAVGEKCPSPSALHSETVTSSSSAPPETDMYQSTLHPETVNPSNPAVGEKCPSPSALHPETVTSSSSALSETDMSHSTLHPETENSSNLAAGESAMSSSALHPETVTSGMKAPDKTASSPTTFDTKSVTSVDSDKEEDAIPAATTYWVNGCCNGAIETKRTLNAALDETGAFEGALNTETDTPASVLGFETVNPSYPAVGEKCPSPSALHPETVISSSSAPSETDMSHSTLHPETATSSNLAAGESAMSSSALHPETVTSGMKAPDKTASSPTTFDTKSVTSVDSDKEEDAIPAATTYWVNGCCNGAIETKRTLNAALDETGAFEGALNTETDTPASVLGFETVNPSNPAVGEKCPSPSALHPETVTSSSSAPSETDMSHSTLHPETATSSNLAAGESAMSSSALHPETATSGMKTPDKTASSQSTFDTKRVTSVDSDTEEDAIPAAGTKWGNDVSDSHLLLTKNAQGQPSFEDIARFMMLKISYADFIQLLRNCQGVKKKVTRPNSACSHHVQSQGYGIEGALKMLLKPNTPGECSDKFEAENSEVMLGIDSNTRLFNKPHQYGSFDSRFALKSDVPPPLPIESNVTPCPLHPDFLMPGCLDDVDVLIDNTKEEYRSLGCKEEIYQLLRQYYEKCPKKFYPNLCQAMATCDFNNLLDRFQGFPNNWPQRNVLTNSRQQTVVDDNNVTPHAQEREAIQACRNNQLQLNGPPKSHVTLDNNGHRSAQKPEANEDRWRNRHYDNDSTKSHQSAVTNDNHATPHAQETEALQILPTDQFQHNSFPNSSQSDVTEYNTIGPHAQKTKGIHELRNDQFPIKNSINSNQQAETDDSNVAPHAQETKANYANPFAPTERLGKTGVTCVG